MRHSKGRDAEAIHHHYDVSNRFYEMVLGPSMTYTCAVFPTEDATLEEAQFAKYDLVCRKLGLQPGMRLLDVGCGWGGMVRHAAKHYGVEVVGVTLSREQAAWAQDAIKREGLDDVAEVRFGDYRDVRDTGFDAVSSIGLTEHIGVRNYPSYFALPAATSWCPAAGCSTTASPGRTTRVTDTGAFIDRYVFPDGELTGSGRIITEIQDVGLEVRHEENLREHYALTLKGWCENLVANWDECVARGRRGHRQGVGPLHGRVAAVASSATRSSCTRCWRSSPTRTATRGSRCARPGSADTSRPTLYRRGSAHRAKTTRPARNLRRVLDDYVVEDSSTGGRVHESCVRCRSGTAEATPRPPPTHRPGRRPGGTPVHRAGARARGAMHWGGTMTALLELTDDLVADAVNGDGDALGAVYTVLAPKVLGYLRAHGAEDPKD